MDGDRFVARYPRLYHMAHFGSWPSIERHGLLSTSRLLDLFAVRGPERDRIESQWRSSSIEIEHPTLGRAVIRDQLPLRPDLLTRCLLNGMTPEAWYRTLNRHVFFWVDEPHLGTLIGARAYRDQPQLVLTLDTRRLLGRHLGETRLSSINSGSILRGGAPRGSSTFLPIAEYQRPYVVELCVIGAVSGVPDLTLVAEHRWPDGRRQTLYESG